MSVTPVLAALVVLDLVDGSVSRWFDAHAFTASTISGLLLLLITVLVINRVAQIRQERDRALVTAAQAATIARQAQRSYGALTDLLKPDRDGDRDNASDEVRTYMGMLMISAPVLIDARQSRDFLEQAQNFGALMYRALSETADGTALSAQLDGRIERAVDRVKATSQPLLDILSAAQRSAVADDGTDGPAAVNGDSAPAADA